MSSGSERKKKNWLKTDGVENPGISRRIFLKGGVMVAVGALVGRAANNKAFAGWSVPGGLIWADEEKNGDKSGIVSLNGVEVYAAKGWEQLPVDLLKGYGLILDPEKADFGGAREDREAVLTQAVSVVPRLEVWLKGVWIGFDREMVPQTVLEEGFVEIPDGIAFVRGSGKEPGIWLKSAALYMMHCGMSRPDLDGYTEITNLTLNAHRRKDDSGNYDAETWEEPSIGDMFFAPIGSEIILTFRNGNISPYVHTGDNFNSTRNAGNVFERHYGFGFNWFRWKTTDVCSWFGARYECAGGLIRILTLDELEAAEPHFYIKFPGKVTGTKYAALARTRGLKGNYERLFTVIHLSDIHGDLDSVQAAYRYADAIRVNFVALTGDNVPYGPYHGYNGLHSVIRIAATPTVYSPGNHDVGNGRKVTDRETVELNFAPIRDVLQAEDGHAWYYRDFAYEGETVRAISLFPFYEKAKTRWYGYYTEPQLRWLCNVLATAPEKSHIFILRHFSHHKPLRLYEDKTMFYDFGSESEDGLNLWLNMDRDPIPEIVDAYNKKSFLHANYIGNLKKGTETVVVDYDFSSRPDSEFVAYFTGHWHCDCFGYTRGAETRQVELSSIGTVGMKGNSGYSSFTSLGNPRDYGTDSQIAFNLFAFDFEKKKVYAARVGNGLRKDREKTWMEFSYCAGEEMKR